MKSVGREMPNNLQAEQALLGSVFMNNQAYHVVSSYLIPEDFYEPIHQKIWKAIGDIIMNDRVATPVNVKSAIPDFDMGGITVAEYLAHLCAEAVTVINAKDYASVIHDLSLRRALITIGQDMVNEAYDASYENSVQTQIDDVEQRIFELSAAHREQSGKGKFAGTAVVSQYLEMVTPDPARRSMHGVPIGLKELATVLSERVFEPTNVYGMISSSGEGKTSLVLVLVRAAIANQNPVLILSYDQSGPQIVSQMVAQELGIETRIQRAGNMTEKQIDKAAGYVRRIAEAPFEVKDCDSSKDTPKRLTKYVKEFIRKNANGKTPLIVIDHAGTIKPDAEDKNADQGTKARNAIQELKACAKGTGATFLVLMQRSSDGMKRFNPRPMKSDVYGGQSAVQPFDAIFYLYRGEYHLQEQCKTAKDDKERGQIEARFSQQYGQDIEGTAEIGALKVRFGTTTQKRKVRFIPEFTRYESMYVPDDEHQGAMF
jgi:replicative DNA helicase